MSIRLPVVANDQGLARYLGEIRKFPILAAEEEYMLARRWREHGDAAAAHKLVTSHLRLVAKIAFGYRGYGLPMSDLIAEGNMGLMKAVKKFEPERGFRLATYALWWIKASVTEYILQSWSMVKLGTVMAQKKLFFSLRRIKAKLGLDGEALLPKQAAGLAKKLGVSTAELVNMDRRLAARDLSLNAPTTIDDGGEIQDLLVDERSDPETIVVEKSEQTHRAALLRAALDTLNEREREIIAERRLKDEPTKLEDLGQRFGISRERVRQIEARAFEKLQAAVLAAAGRPALPQPV